MGKRARKGGLANAVIRAQRDLRSRTEQARDSEANKIAQRVYAVAVDVKGTTQLPLVIHAPVQMAAELAAVGIVKVYELPGGQRAVEDVAAYMVSGFAAFIAEFNVEHFRAWQEGLGKLEGEGYGGRQAEGRHDKGGQPDGAGGGERGPAGEGGPQEAGGGG